MSHDDCTTAVSTTAGAADSIWADAAGSLADVATGSVVDGAASSTLGVAAVAAVSVFGFVEALGLDVKTRPMKLRMEVIGPPLLVLGASVEFPAEADADRLDFCESDVLPVFGEAVDVAEQFDSCTTNR